MRHGQNGGKLPEPVQTLPWARHNPPQVGLGCIHMAGAGAGAMLAPLVAWLRP